MTVTYDIHALIEEARRRARQRRWTYVGVLALLVGAGSWGGLAFMSGSGAITPPPAPPGYQLVRARGSVQHALVAGFFRSGLNGYPVGKGAMTHLEVWFDRETGLIRSRGCWANRCFPAEASRCVPFCASSIPANLFYGYWPVDTTKFVRRPGIGTFHGRQVIWIGRRQDTFAPAFRNGEWIALNPRTHDAVADQMYGTTDKREGQILAETWVVKRFADVAPNRFWFAVKNKGLDVRFVRFEPAPLYVPGREPPDLRHATRVLVGRLAGATIFARSRRDGSWRMFSVSKDGRVDGHSRVDDPLILRAGLVQVGHGSLFTSRAYLVVAGSTLARRGTKLFAVYADGSRRPIRLMLSRKPVAPAAFHYYVIPKVNQVRGHRATALELVRGSRLIARQMLPLPYQAPNPNQPGPLALKAALHALDS
jgi:hypothetical protein